MTEFHLWAAVYFAGGAMIGILIDDRPMRLLSMLGMMLTVFG